MRPRRSKKTKKTRNDFDFNEFKINICFHHQRSGLKQLAQNIVKK